MTLKRSDFRFIEPLRVRWAEVDMQKIVFNGHYLMYFDTAVAGYWRALAMPYHETMEAMQGDLFVRKATLEYEASARYDEQLAVGIRCGRIGSSSMLIHAAVFRGEQRLVHGELVYVFADPVAQTSKPVPPALREWFQAYEDGARMAEVTRGDWAALGEPSRAIRQAVFIDEQRIPADLVVDAADPLAVHAVAFNRIGLALAAGRLLPARDGVGRIGRLATLASMRGVHLGRSVLEALLAAARERGDRQVMLTAQASAITFYERLGFERHGAMFEEAGIPHQEMRRVP